MKILSERQLSIREDVIKRYFVIGTYLIVSVLCILVSNYTIYFLFLLFPAIFLIKSSKINWFFNLPIIISLNLASLVVFAVLFSLVNIPITGQTLLVCNVVLTCISYYFIEVKKFKKLELGEFDLVSAIGIYSVFIVAVFARLVSVVGEKAPILHDPISHAFWARSIDETGKLDYFYSPGLHIYIFLNSDISGASFAQSTLFVTNFLSAFAVLTWGIVAYLITKNRVFTLVLSLAIFSLPYPFSLYSAGGKNALIVAITFVPIAVYFIHRFTLNVNFFNALGLCIASLAVFFLHSPTGGFLYISMFLVLAFFQIKKFQDKNAFLHALKYSVILGISLILISALWFLNTNTDRAKVTSNQVTTLNSYGSKNVAPPVKDIKTQPKPHLVIKDTLKEYLNFYSGFGYSYKYILIASTIVILLLGFKSGHLFVFVPLMVVIGVTIVNKYLKISSLDIVVETGFLLAFPILALFIASAAALLWKFSAKPKIYAGLGIIVFLFVLQHFGLQQYRSFDRNTAGVNMLDRSDVEAFRWLENNVGKKQGILNDANQDGPGSIRIFPTTGASWIPAFTDNKISMAFQSGKYADVLTHKNYGNYLKLRTDFEDGFCSLYNEGFRYYYHDFRTPYSSPISVIEILPVENRKLLYRNDGVEIYRLQINDEECGN